MKKRIVSIVLAAVLSAGIFSAPAQEYLGSISYAAAAASTVAAPSVSRKAGTYATSSSLSIKLTTSTDDADIYYSTGSSYKLYTKPLKLTKNTTLKCYAIKDGVKSTVKTYKYKLSPKVTFSKAGGTYNESVSVKLSSSTSGAKLYYTTDGSKPTTSSKQYSSAIKISRTTTLRVLAAKSGWTNKYYTAEYTINSTNSAGSANSILDDYTSKYAYSTLDSTQKQVYAKLFEAAKEHADYADLYGIGAVLSDIQKTYWAFDYDNPQFFWLANGYKYTTMGSQVVKITMVYSRTKSQADQIAPLFEQAAQEILDDALATDDLFERVKIIHDAIVDRTEYTLKGPSYISEADGPLVYGKALCEGYSKAFMYLCQRAGIQCICIAGSGNSQDHMWNMIQLDGEWYHMDVTWDDNNTYDYFCIPTKKITTDHKINNFFPIPEATATKYSYTTAMGITEYTTANAAYNAFIKQASANWKKGVYETTIYMSDGLMSSFTSKLKKQGYNDLSANGCNARSWSSRYTNRSITVTLS